MDKEIKCEICGKEYKRHDMLRLHMLHKHGVTNEKVEDEKTINKRVIQLMKNYKIIDIQEDRIIYKKNGKYFCDNCYKNFCNVKQAINHKC